VQFEAVPTLPLNPLASFSALLPANAPYIYMWIADPPSHTATTNNTFSHSIITPSGVVCVVVETSLFLSSTPLRPAVTLSGAENVLWADRPVGFLYSLEIPLRIDNCLIRTGIHRRESHWILGDTLIFTFTNCSLSWCW